MSIRQTIAIAAAIICAAVQAAMAQDLRIISISDGAYPEIEVRARVAESVRDSLAIVENGTRVQCTVQDSETSQLYGDGRMYVFLVENSYSFFHNGVFQPLKNTLLSMCDYLGKYDNANILTFGTPGRNVKYTSAEQTGDLRLLREITEYSLKPQDDSTYFDNNLISAIEEAVEYASRHQKSQQTIVLTVIARPLNLSNVREFSEDFKDRLMKSGVYLNMMLYESESHNIRRELESLAQASGGNISNFNEKNIEAALVQSIEKMSKTKARSVLKEVVVTFEATQEGARNSFDIKYGDTMARCEYTNPNKSGFLGKYPIAVSILIGLLAVIAAAIFFVKTRNRIIRRIDSNAQTHYKELQRQNRQLKQEIEKYKRHPLSLAHSFDNIYIEETLIGSGKIVPKLVVDDHKTQQVFKLNKFTMTLGRAEGNDIVIDNRTVSSHHATLTNEGGLFYIADNDSTNGVFVNDIRITKSKIQPKDRIRIGAVMATLVY